TIAEIEDTGPGATGNDLIERIKRIEGIGRGGGLHLTGPGTFRLPSEPRRVWRSYPTQVTVRRNGQSRLPFGVKRACRDRRQFIVLFDISRVKVAKNLQLITTDLVAEGRITTPSFLFGIGTGEKVKVKARQWGRGRPSVPTTVVEVGVRWSQTVRTTGGTGKFQKTRPRHSRATGGGRNYLTHIEVPGAGIGAQEWRGARVGKISVKRVVMVEVKDVTGNGHLVIPNTKEDVRLISTGVVGYGVAIIFRHLDPSEIFPQLDIDHPSHGVRAVHRRSARLQNFDALNRRHRDGIDIDKGASEHSSNTASIQQNQAGSWIQSAQRHRSKPDRATLARAVVGDRNTV